jgi:hypothetical protein
MKKHVVLSAIALVFFLTFGGVITASTGYAANSSIDGEWQASYSTPIGAMNCHYIFKSAGDQLSGKVIAEMGGNQSESEITDGKIEGDKVTFAWTYNDVPMAVTGKITGDEIQLTRQAGSYGSESAVATRKASGK